MEPETIADVLALIAERPADAELWQLLGQRYLRQEQMPEAKEAYDRSLELAPNDPWTHLYLGNWFWGNREHRKALECFKRAAELRPDEAIVYTCQGDIFRSQGRHDLAEDAYRMAVQIDPDNSDARRKLSEWFAFRYADIAGIVVKGGGQIMSRSSKRLIVGGSFCRGSSLC